jgi:RNA polymerase sigma-70 factor (ECF subfamily)
MNALVGSYPGCVVSLDASLEQEFEQRLADCPTLAFRVALGVLRNRAEAEDVAQDALLRAYRNFHRLRDRERFRAWLVRMTWRIALDRIRSAGRRERREQASLVPAPESTAEDVAASSEFERHLHAAIDELPEKLRLVVILNAIEGHDVHEVARLLDVPEGTVKSRIYMARKRLAETLRWAANSIKAG